MAVSVCENLYSKGHKQPCSGTKSVAVCMFPYQPGPNFEPSLGLVTVPGVAMFVCDYLCRKGTNNPFCQKITCYHTFLDYYWLGTFHSLLLSSKLFLDFIFESYDEFPTISAPGIVSQDPHPGK